MARWAASSGEIEQTRLREQSKPDRWLGSSQQLVELRRDAFTGQVADKPGPCLDRRQRCGLYLEPERRRQPDDPDGAQGILLESHARVADGAQDPGGDIGASVIGIDERRRSARSSAPGHRVDR
jgi:hypothetical protein